jgi:hypothetical protein
MKSPFQAFSFNFSGIWDEMGSNILGITSWDLFTCNRESSEPEKYIPPGESDITNGCGNIPRLLLWGGGFPFELLWGFKGVLLVVPID